METILLVLLGLAMAGVVGTLLVGVVGMARGGEFNARAANRLMRLRIILQGTALVLLALVMLMRWS